MSRAAEPLSQAMALLEKLEPGAPATVQANLDAFSPDAVELMLGYALVDIVGRDGIDLRTHEMLTVAMLAAMGTAPDQLERALTKVFAGGGVRGVVGAWF